MHASYKLNLKSGMINKYALIGVKQNVEVWSYTRSDIINYCIKFWILANI